MGGMRRIAFTPAAERALALAAAWTTGDDLAPTGLPEVVLALVSEPECRAAELLARLAVDEATVRQRWPGLKERRTGRELQAGIYSPGLRDALLAARDRLAESLEREIATEHLLWGMAHGHDEMAAWLMERGIDRQALDAEFFGGNAEPIEIAMEELGGEEPGTRSQEVVSTVRVDHTAVFRALDAAGNRAREGLRVAEDYVRFVLDDRHLTERLKVLRHDLSAALERLPAARRLAARDTVADVGTSVTTASEGFRADTASVATASLKRTGEALRSLEEFGKTVDAGFAGAIEALRYRLYTVEKAIGLTTSNLARLAASRLYVLIDGCDSGPAFEQLVRELIEARVDFLQLRDKQLPDRELLARAQLLRAMTRDTATLFVMNDRPDLARLAGADGVHIGQEELTVKQVRQIVGPEMLVGVSTHSLRQAKQAVLDGASYLGVGPTFPSSTKQFDAFPGLEFVRAVAASIRLPAFAIGGINLENVDQVVAAGFSRVAVSAAVRGAEDPGLAARKLRAKLG